MDTKLTEIPIRDVGFTPLSEMKLIVGDLPVDHVDFGKLLAVAIKEEATSTIVLDLEIVDDMADAHAWFDVVARSQPWVVRS